MKQSFLLKQLNQMIRLNHVMLIELNGYLFSTKWLATFLEIM